MKNLLAMLAVAAALCMSADRVQAQAGGGGGGGRGGRNFDPAQMEQRFMDRAKTELGFTNDTEWSAVQPLVQKVFDARREMMQGMFRGFGRRGGQGGDNGGPTGSTGNTERDALQQAVDQNAPSAQIKSALDKYRAAQKTKQANLEQAQNALRQVLSQKQEAQAVLMGLLN